MYIRFCGFMDDSKICTSNTVDIQILPTEIQRTSSYLGHRQFLLGQSHDFSVVAIYSSLRRDDDDDGIIHKICC